MTQLSFYQQLYSALTANDSQQCTDISPDAIQRTKDEYIAFSILLNKQASKWAWICDNATTITLGRASTTTNALTDAGLHVVVKPTARFKDLNAIAKRIDEIQITPVRIDDEQSAIPMYDGVIAANTLFLCNIKPTAAKYVILIAVDDLVQASDTECANWCKFYMQQLCNLDDDNSTCHDIIVEQPATISTTAEQTTPVDIPDSTNGNTETESPTSSTVDETTGETLFATANVNIRYIGARSDTPLDGEASLTKSSPANAPLQDRNKSNQFNHSTTNKFFL